MRPSYWFLVLFALGMLAPGSLPAQEEGSSDGTATEVTELPPGVVALPPPIFGPAPEGPPPDAEPLVGDEPLPPDADPPILVQEEVGDLPPLLDEADALLLPEAEFTSAFPPEELSEDPLPPEEESTEILTAPEGEEIALPPESESYIPPPPTEEDVSPPPVGEWPELAELPPELGQPPVLAPLSAQTVDEGQPLTFTVSAIDPDADQTTMIFPSALPTGASFDGTTFSWTPGFAQAGTYVVGFVAMDSGAPALLSPQQDVTITVNDVNQAPTFARGEDQTVPEDAGPQSAAGWATAISPGAADENSQTLAFAVTNDNHALFAAQPALAADGTLSYAPAPNVNGTATVTVQLHDNGGTERGGVDTSAPQTFTLTVNPVNDPPVLTEVAPQSVDEGQELTFRVTASDIDSPLTLSMAGAPTGPSPSLTDNHDGTADFAWTPGYTQASVYTVVFTATDGELSHSQSAQITVINVTRTLSATAGANGSITPAGEVVVDYGAEQSFAIAANTGYHIEDVLVDGVSGGAVASYTFSNVTDNHTIAASFAINTYTLSATAGPNGSITPVGATIVTYGSSQTFAIAPATGYAIADVLVDGASVGAVASYTFSNVTADHTIAASFVDRTAPTVTAQLVAVWGTRHDDEDDDGDGQIYRVQVRATDNADPQPVVAAYITQPLSPTANVAVTYKKEKKNRIKIKEEKRRIQVQLEGPSESALRALWTQALAQGGFSVADNQVVRLSPKREDHPEAAYQFDRQLTLISGKAAGLKLVASATDASGNQSAKVEAAPSRRRHAKSAEEALAEGVEIVTEHFRLQPNYPNPFNPSTTLRYTLDDLQEVRLAIYNVMGQRVRVLVDQAQGPGSYEVEWNGLDEAGQQVAGGLYFYQLQAGSQQARGRMLFLK